MWYARVFYQGFIMLIAAQDNIMTTVLVPTGGRQSESVLCVWPRVHGERGRGPSGRFVHLCLL